MRAAQENHFITHDGTELFYRHWPAAGPADKAIVLFHRGHEHSGRLQHVVDELGLDDFACFAWDARGHGKSPGARGDSDPARAARDGDPPGGPHGHPVDALRIQVPRGIWR